MPHFENFVKITGTVGPAAERILGGKRVLVATLQVRSGATITVHIDNPDRTIVRSVWQSGKLLTVAGRLCFGEEDSVFIFATSTRLLSDPLRVHTPWPKNEVGDRKEFFIKCTAD